MNFTGTPSRAPIASAMSGETPVGSPFGALPVTSRKLLMLIAARSTPVGASSATIFGSGIRVSFAKEGLGLAIPEMRRSRAGGGGFARRLSPVQARRERNGGACLSQQFAGLRRLGLQRMQEPHLRGRRAIGVADAEFAELSRVAWKRGVRQRDRQADAAIGVAHCRAYPVDRFDQLRMIGLAADSQ